MQLPIHAKGKCVELVLHIFNFSMAVTQQNIKRNQIYLNLAALFHLMKHYRVESISFLSKYSHHTVKHKKINFI